jgi:hypothetical protein
MHTAKGPAVSLRSHIFTEKSHGHLLTVGLYPITPQHDAGILIDPPVSVPIEIGKVDDPTHPPLPLLDPPAINSSS